MLQNPAPLYAASAFPLSERNEKSPTIRRWRGQVPGRKADITRSAGGSYCGPAACDINQSRNKQPTPMGIAMHHRMALNRMVTSCCQA